MKKIITLLFSFGLFATSFAQYNRGHNNRDDQYVYNQRDHYGKGNYDIAKNRNLQIERINREFDYKIQSIKNNRYLNRRAKKAAIKNAEKDRKRQIKIVNDRFKYARSDNRYNDWNNTWNH
jgi:hypothetical protein